MEFRTNNWLYGLVFASSRFRYRGRTHPLPRESVRQLKKLARIADLADGGASGSPTWLLAYRGVFRDILENTSPAMLAWLVEQTGHVSLKRLAIWLLGRHDGTLGTLAIANAAQHPEVAMRREVARALKRKHAWSQLREIFADDPDDRVRRLAEQHSPPSHRDRLNTFLADVAPQKPSGQRTQLRMNVDMEAEPGRPPKSPQFIRYILEHIRLLVRSHKT